MGRRIALFVLALCVAGCTRDPRVPRDYPRGYAGVIAAGEREGALLIWSATDRAKAAPLLAEFGRAYPRIRVSYVEMSAKPMNDRFLAATSGDQTPDILWSPAMDLQIKLSNDGHAQRYLSPEAANLPSWANWKDQAWGTTAEPIVLAYNRRLMPDTAVPRTHAALATLIEREADRLRGRVAAYDVSRSAVGYLYLSQDAQATPDIWRLVEAMRRAHARLYTRAESMLEAVERGDAVFGYDVVGSYALEQARRDPAVGMVLFRDYTLLMSRIALITARAPHPDAARLFVDFLLSRRGQRRLAEEAMPSIRRDVRNPAQLSPGDVPLRAIRVGPGLLVTQDQLTRRYFMRRWGGASAINARSGTAETMPPTGPASSPPAPSS